MSESASGFAVHNGGDNARGFALRSSSGLAGEPAGSERGSQTGRTFGFGRRATQSAADFGGRRVCIGADAPGGRGIDAPQLLESDPGGPWRPNRPCPHIFLPTPRGRFSDVERVSPYYQQMLEKIESVPGIQKAAVTTGIPTLGTGFGRRFSIAGAPPVDPAARPGAGFQMVTPGYFETFGIRVVKGRGFTEQDRAKSMRVAMVNENFVNRYLSGADPLAQRILTDELVPGSTLVGPPVEWQIMNVFHNVRNSSGLRNDHPEIYVPFWQSPWPQAAVAARTSDDPARALSGIAAAVNSIDPDLPLAGVKTMDQQIGEVLAFDRFGMVLYGSFAALALLLATVEIYGVINFAVAQRTQEFGLRMALGARGANILSMVLREGGTLAAGGMIFGLGGAYLVGRAMQTTLYGVEALDIVAFSASAFALLTAGLLACYVPARRASKVDPLVALRCE